jgi:hypothetical protein
MCTKNTLELYNTCSKTCRNSVTSLLEGLTQIGRQSVIIDSTFGHQDSSDGQQTKKVKEDFQSKIVLVSVGWNNFLFETDGSVSPGVVALPRYRLYTNCMALRYIEVHAITNIVHGSSRQSFSNELRGAWYYCKQTDTCKFLPAGCALTRIIK